MGPLGRSADASLRLGRKGAALCYSYSLSRGAFIGAHTIWVTQIDWVLCSHARAFSAAARHMCSVLPRGAATGGPDPIVQGLTSQMIS